MNESRMGFMLLDALRDIQQPKRTNDILVGGLQMWVSYFDGLQFHEDPDDKLAQIRNQVHGKRVEASRQAIALAQRTK